MKKITLIIIMAFCLSISLGVNNGIAQESVPMYQAGEYDPQGEVVTVKAKGLVCDFCAKALEKVFLKHEEVSAINVDLSTKEININLKSGQNMDDELIKKLVIDAGYNIDEFVRNGGSQ